MPDVNEGKHLSGARLSEDGFLHNTCEAVGLSYSAARPAGMSNTCSCSLYRVPHDLKYRLDIARRSLASTASPNGEVRLNRTGVIELLELLEDAGATADELARLRRRLLELVNDPTHRTAVIRLRDVADLLR